MTLKLYEETEREVVWEWIQKQYVDFLSDCRTDLGGKKNFTVPSDFPYLVEVCGLQQAIVKKTDV